MVHLPLQEVACWLPDVNAHKATLAHRRMCCLYDKPESTLDSMAARTYGFPGGTGPPPREAQQLTGLGPGHDPRQVYNAGWQGCRLGINPATLAAAGLIV